MKVASELQREGLAEDEMLDSTTVPVVSMKEFLSKFQMGKNGETSVTQSGWV